MRRGSLPEIRLKELTLQNVHGKVEELGLLPGMKPILQASSRETSLGNASLILPGNTSPERQNTSPIGKGAGDVGEIFPHSQGRQET